MLPELPECSHWWKCPFTPGEEIERLRGEVELLRHERDAAKAALYQSCEDERHNELGWVCPLGHKLNEVEAERDALKAELARHYTLSSDKDKYVFDRDMKAQFSAIDAAREE